MFAKRVVGRCLWQTLITMLTICSYAVTGQINIISPASGRSYPKVPGYQYAWVPVSWSYTQSAGYDTPRVKVWIDNDYKGEFSSASDVYVTHSGNPHSFTRAELWERRASDNQRVCTQAVNGYWFYLVEGVYLTVSNSFGSGSVEVDGDAKSSGARISIASGSSHTLRAIDWQNVYDASTQKYYFRRFREWMGISNSIEINVTPYASQSYTARFVKQLDVTFRTTNGTRIRVWGATWSSPTIGFGVAEDRTIDPEAVTPYRVVNGMEELFSNWTDDRGRVIGTSPLLVFTPSDHGVYTANFSTKPQAPQGLQATGSVGQHVRLTWSVNPHAGVTYRIVRQRKVESQEVATIGVGGHEWTDPDVVVTGTGQDELLQYQIFSVYAGVSSDPSGAVICAKYFPTGNDQDLVVGDEGGEMPTNYRVGNYPNPFNPSTTISYDLPTAASVKIDVFDLMGRRVRSVVDATRSAGCHSAIWNGRDDSGKDVSSGVYVYRFDAIPLDGGKGFRQSGKLMLTR